MSDPQSSKHAAKMTPAMLGGVVIILFLVCLLCLGASGLALAVFETRSAAASTAKTPAASNPLGIVGSPAYASLGAPAPDFELATPTGQTVRLSDLRGGAVLINFWATWCYYCIEEMPLIQMYSDLYAAEIVILAVDEGDSRQDVSNFITNNGYTFTFLMDPNYQIGDAYRVDGYPITYFIDAEGIIRYRADGEMEEQDILNGLSAIGVVR